MGISVLLDVAIGLAFIFLIFSLLASGAYEVGARALATRSKHLWKGLHELLDGDDGASSVVERAKDVVSGDHRPKRDGGTDKWTDKLYVHPLIGKLDDTKTFKRAWLSHIDADDFSRALLDIVWKEATELVQDGDDKEPEHIGEAIARVREMTSIPAPFLDDLEVYAKQLGNNIDRVKDEVSRWFDSRMENLSRSYRKNSRWWLFAIGIVVAAVFNVDAIDATAELYSDDALRQAVVTQATEIVEECAAEEAEKADDGATPAEDSALHSDPDVIDCVDREVGKVAGLLSLPVGHTDGFNLTFAGAIGWLIAAAALAQGAPFWFDALSRMSGLKKRLD